MGKKRSHIARVGVTGGIGSGKSAVCKIFERLGVPVLSADLIAREISDSEPLVKKKIVAAFGTESYCSDGKLNRPYVAALVFSNKKLQDKLNSIVHPKVRDELERRIGLVRASSPFLVIEAALIYEVGLDDMLDAVVVADAVEEKRIARVVERDGTSPEFVRKRMNAQWSQRAKLDRADIVIGNNDSLSELDSQVQFVYTLLVQRYKRA